MPRGRCRAATGALEVLIADSNERTRTMHAALGRSLGWQVSEACSIEQTLLLAAQAGRFHAVIVDASMEGEPALRTALKVGTLLAGSATALLVLGTVQGYEALARLDAAQQSLIGSFIARPVTARMLARGIVDAQDTEPPEALHRALQPRPLAGLRLLVAEDNENNQFVARELLTAQGATVEIAVDGMDALTKLVAGGVYDAILMDWQMPLMDGLEATREIRQIVGYKNIPIVAMTANALESDRQECLAAGMNAHVAKPFVLQELVAVLLQQTRPGTVAPGAIPRRVLPAPAPVAVQQPPGPASALLDREGAVARLGGNAELHEQLLPLFRADAPKTLSALIAACERGARQDAHRLAHTLKGTAGTLGALHLADMAGLAEAVLASPPSPADHGAIEGLRQAVERTLGAMGV
jgi:CheY-like chemotaxis protein